MEAHFYILDEPEYCERRKRWRCSVIDSLTEEKVKDTGWYIHASTAIQRGIQMKEHLESEAAARTPIS